MPSLSAHPPWRQILILTVLLPIVVVAAVLAFAFPAARTAPRDLPIGVVGTGPAAARLAGDLQDRRPGAFDLRLYADDAQARAAIAHRDVYGAFVTGGDRLTLLTASAAAPVVATQLQAVATATGMPVRVRDVVPTSADDPRGAVLSSAVLPLTMCGVLVAAIVGLMLRFRPARRQLVALAAICVAAALGAYLIVQGFLGALPGGFLATWGAVALLMGAVAATVTGLVALAGTPGMGIGAATMIFVGNAFSGASSAPELLPTGIGHLGQWMPTGAGVSLLRDTAYFHGHGAGPHVAVLGVWAVLGAAAVLVGHLRAFPFAASPRRREPAAGDGAPAAGDGPPVVGAPVAPVTRATVPERPALVAAAAGRHERTG